MSTGNLRLIRDVAHHRSVSKAARLNHLSQSAASQAIAELERELEVILFDRGRRPLEVTPAGKLYLEYCKDMLRRDDELRASLDLLKKHVNGTARVAAIYSVGLSEMSQIEARFAARFPDAELAVQYLRPERVWEAVAMDEADLGLMSYAESSRELVALPWRDEEMVVAVAPGHALARRESDSGHRDSRRGIYRVRRRSADSGTDRPLSAGQKSHRSSRPPLRQHTNDQGSGGARSGDQYHAGARHARRHPAGPAGRAAAQTRGAISAGPYRPSPPKIFNEVTAGLLDLLRQKTSLRGLATR